MALSIKPMETCIVLVNYVLQKFSLFESLEFLTYMATV